MGDLSKDFDKSEFVCRGKGCCDHKGQVTPELVAALQELQDRIGKPIYITSGFRCKKHNAFISGDPHSQHMVGKAADIQVVGVNTTLLAIEAQNIMAFKRGGIGLYGGWVHVDVRDDGPARWEG